MERPRPSKPRSNRSEAAKIDPMHIKSTLLGERLKESYGYAPEAIASNSAVIGLPTYFPSVLLHDSFYSAAHTAYETH